MYKLIIFTYMLFTIVSYGEIKIVYYDSFPPYSWKDSDGKMKGIWIDIINEVFEKEMGIEVSHEGYPWARAQYLVRNGEADGLIGMATSNRKDYMNFNAVPIYTSKINVYTSSRNERLESIRKIEKREDFERFSIVDIIGNKWSDTKFGDLNILYVRNLDSVFNVLISGRNDLTFSDSLVIEYYIKEHNLENEIEDLSIVLDMVDSYLGIGKMSNYQYVLEDFDIVFEKLKLNGTIENIISKYFYKEETSKTED